MCVPHSLACAPTDPFPHASRRRIATETLLEFANEHRDHQYVFLTPQDIQTVRNALSNLEKHLGVRLPPAFLKTALICPAR